MIDKSLEKKGCHRNEIIFLFCWLREIIIIKKKLHKKILNKGGGGGEIT